MHTCNHWDGSWAAGNLPTGKSESTIRVSQFTKKKSQWSIKNGQRMWTSSSQVRKFSLYTGKTRLNLGLNKKEMQREMTRMYPFLPVGLRKIRMFDHTLNQAGGGETHTLQGRWEYKWAQPPWTAIWHSIKVLGAHARWPIKSTALGCLPQTYLHICMQSWMYKAIHCRSVYNNRRLETAGMSINRGLLK